MKNQFIFNSASTSWQFSSWLFIVFFMFGAFSMEGRNIESTETSCHFSTEEVIEEESNSVMNFANGFHTTWETTTANESITIPTSHFWYSFNYDVDWGDGTITTGETGNATHIYAAAGTYSIKITGTFPQIFFGGTAVE